MVRRSGSEGADVLAGPLRFCSGLSGEAPGASKHVPGVRLEPSFASPPGESLHYCAIPWKWVRTKSTYPSRVSAT